MIRTTIISLSRSSTNRRLQRARNTIRYIQHMAPSTIAIIGMTADVDDSTTTAMAPTSVTVSRRRLPRRARADATPAAPTSSATRDAPRLVSHIRHARPVMPVWALCHCGLHHVSTSRVIVQDLASLAFLAFSITFAIPREIHEIVVADLRPRSLLVNEP